MNVTPEDVSRTCLRCATGPGQHEETTRSAVAKLGAPVPDVPCHEAWAQVLSAKGGGGA
jgi:hypothetical protein